MHSVFEKLNAMFEELYGALGAEALEPPVPVLWNATATGTATGTLSAANEFRGVPLLVPRRVRVNRARVRCSSASGAAAASFAVGIYSADGSQRLTQSAPVAVPSALANVAAALEEVVLEPGAYHVGLSCDSTAPAFMVNRVAPLLGGGQHPDAPPAGLPPSVAVGNATADIVPIVGLYFAPQRS